MSSRIKLLTAAIVAMAGVGGWPGELRSQSNSLYRYCTAINEKTVYFTAVSLRTHQGAYYIDGMTYLRPGDAFSGWLKARRGIATDGAGCVTKFTLSEAQAARDEDIKAKRERRAVVTEFSVDDA